MGALNKSIPKIPDRKIRTKWEKIVEEATEEGGGLNASELEECKI
jgi:hypothetical protein